MWQISGMGCAAHDRDDNRFSQKKFLTMKHLDGTDRLGKLIGKNRPDHWRIGSGASDY